MPEKEDFFLNILRKYRAISIIGTAKNVGKTTTLNYLIDISRNNFKLGLTSIGRDGESKDVIYSSPKPRIFVEKETIIATAKNCLLNSDITKEIIAITDYNTPLGKIVIVKALSDGFVELAGPSKNSELLKIKEELINLKCDVVLIDGAINRKSYASPLLTDATIIATGAAFSTNIYEIIDQTTHLINLLSLKSESNPKIISLSKRMFKSGTIGIIYDDYKMKIIKSINVRDAIKKIDKKLFSNFPKIVIKGLITDNIMAEIMGFSDYYNRIVLLIEDSTKLFISRDILSKFQKSGGILKVLYPIKIVGVTINPKSPNGEGFSSEKFLKLIKQKINIPVFNLLEEG